MQVMLGNTVLQNSLIYKRQQNLIYQQSKTINFSYLFEHLPIRLELIFLTEHLPGAQTVSHWKPPGRIFEHLVQGVHPGFQQRGQLPLAVDGSVRSSWVSAYGTCLDSSGSLQISASPGKEVPGEEGDDRVDPDYRAEDLQQHWVDVLLHLHLSSRFWARALKSFLCRNVSLLSTVKDAGCCSIMHQKMACNQEKQVNFQQLCNIGAF